ncbi:hypothetical protein [Ornithinibacillus contaminans]|uniref:hypothetical protein n=1 Tax=Ornithinibacillus contaminans TaxID=694055 RepID=UPI00064D86ED|nr:hypothetical protein [Ornithinibacillus contaminans]
MNTEKSTMLLKLLEINGPLQMVELLAKLDIEKITLSKLIEMMKQQTLIIEVGPELFAISSTGRSIIKSNGKKINDQEIMKQSIHNQMDREIKNIYTVHDDNRVLALEERLKRLKKENVQLKDENLQLQKEIEVNHILEKEYDKGNDTILSKPALYKIAELEHKIEKLTYEKNNLIVENQDLQRDLQIEKYKNRRINTVKIQSADLADKI